MKQFYLFALLSILFVSAYSQFNLGGFHANFGVDADTRAGYTKYGPGASSPAGDDWFASPGNPGRGVIDTTNAAYYKLQLQNGKHISFVKNMSVPAYSQINNKLWIDAIYLRDYTGGRGAYGKDSTAFGTSAKNGEDPRDWDGRQANVPDKDDIIDAFAHIRRDGTRLTDSLWLFTGVSTFATDGDRYFDIELFKNRVTYSCATGAFTSEGLSNGHTEWIFDSFGNIIQMGDLIIAVSYKPGQAPLIETRIWVSRLTYQLIHPALFNFGDSFDGGFSAGYASIESQTGTAAFGSGIGNFSNSEENDTTFATPWGSDSKYSNWSMHYDQLQFVEIGLNLTRLGIDPALYNSLFSSSCGRIFQSIFFKSRASTSFSANLHDFAGPIDFTSPGAGLVSELTVTSDTLTCSKHIGTLTISNPSPVGVYAWSTLDGNIVDFNTDKSIITVNKKGIYFLTTSLATGCPAIRMESISVPADNFSPVASADLGMTPSGDLQLLGGDPVLSDKLTPFGRSKGLIWEWKGPNGFTSNEQNPMINSDWAWGAYYLTLKEARNGCEAMATLDVSFQTKKQLDLVKDVSNNATAQTYLWRNTNADKLVLVSTQPSNASGRVVIYNAAGQLISKKNIQFVQGQNNIELPLKSTKQVIIVSVYVGQQLSFTRKVLF